MNEADAFVENAFLAGIGANPMDRLAQLVYADWLDEKGEPEQAEFLRTQHTVVSAVERLAEVRPAIPEQWFKQVDLFSQTFTLFRLPPVLEETGVTVSKLHVQPCQRLAAGTDVLDIESDKFTCPVRVDYDCVLLAMLVEIGQSVPIGTPLALLLRV